MNSRIYDSFVAERWNKNTRKEEDIGHHKPQDRKSYEDTVKVDLGEEGVKKNVALSMSWSGASEDNEWLDMSAGKGDFWIDEAKATNQLVSSEEESSSSTVGHDVRKFMGHCWTQGECSNFRYMGNKGQYGKGLVVYEPNKVQSNCDGRSLSSSRMDRPTYMGQSGKKNLPIRDIQKPMSGSQSRLFIGEDSDGIGEQNQK
ncbi:hypothetical protein LWI29_005002 [Acer saccharum]|uniref:Uncharacterized protein n=1 Tax=Acer saccharum TaxID=4024 RepID=A0AA39VFC0_ACESA|nr:hypothetical protein LWI29_005002 [Acer saccharum]